MGEFFPRTVTKDINLYNLPYEVLLNILTHLSQKELSTVSRVSKYILEIYKDDYLWKVYIQNKYCVGTKIFKDKTWRDNFMYILCIFTPKQLEILNKINTLSPKHIDLLRQLTQYTLYPEQSVDIANGQVYNYTAPLDKVIVWVSQSKKYPNFRKRYLLAPHSRRNGSYLELSIENSKLLTNIAYNFSITITSSLYKNGSEITQDNDTIYYIVALTRQQLSCITHMYI